MDKPLGRIEQLTQFTSKDTPQERLHALGLSDAFKNAADIETETSITTDKLKAETEALRQKLLLMHALPPQKKTTTQRQFVAGWEWEFRDSIKKLHGEGWQIVPQTITMQRFSSSETMESDLFFACEMVKDLP